MPTTDIDAIIRVLYRTAIHEPVDHLPQWCFELVRQYLNFSSGSWIYTSCGDSLNPHAAWLYQLPRNGLDNFRNCKEIDRLFK